MSEIFIAKVAIFYPLLQPHFDLLRQVGEIAKLTIQISYAVKNEMQSNYV